MLNNVCFFLLGKETSVPLVIQRVIQSEEKLPKTLVQEKQEETRGKSSRPVTGVGTPQCDKISVEMSHCFNSSDLGQCRSESFTVTARFL